MRATLYLTLALLAAGCVAEAPAAGTEDAPPANEGEPSPTSAPDPVAPAPAAPVEIRHDYSAAAETVEFDLVPGAYDVVIGWYAPDSVMGCVTADARVVVTTPEGETYADLAPSAVQTPCDGNTNSKQAREMLAGGKWTAEFTGSGVAVAVVKLTPL